MGHPGSGVRADEFMARGFMLQAHEAPLFPLPDPILAAATSSSSSSEPLPSPQTMSQMMQPPRLLIKQLSHLTPRLTGSERNRRRTSNFWLPASKAFKQGQNFAAWQASNIAALAEFHHLPQTLLINAVEQKLDTKVQKLMEPMMAKVRTLEQFLTRLLLHGPKALVQIHGVRTK